ncbi:ACT domain-containing protein [Glaciecola sp. MH2013]|uniref:ACT domain-containing protein n=1 Tax=Glaciecola sp. MH2013 TaxID=2785524 RepID=UPI0018A11D75|nr:ACT domain-containing protein [Glaciecola sp. MH2013]MBF7072981.1 ACT domain-containing protein [Glaciecola sp. MH2013]
MAKQTLSVLDDTFAIHSLSEDQAIPAPVLSSDIYFIGKTHDELSLVVKQSLPIEAIESDYDWRVLEVLGPLNLSMVGIMADIGAVLASAKVSIFVVSTFETDYFLVKNDTLATAISALEKAKYEVIQD